MTLSIQIDAYPNRGHAMKPEIGTFNPIPTGLWNDVEHWGGPYLAPGIVGSLNLSKHLLVPNI